jgi:hypothetical protein
MIPLFIGASPPGRRLAIALRCAGVSVFLVGIAFLDNPANTFRALVKQPTPPAVNHATPWVALAPRMHALPTLSSAAAKVGGRLFPEITSSPGSNLLVEAGPGRVVYLVLAVLLGLVVWRRPPSPARLVWMGALVLAMRCFFEAVMTPYYLGPPLILALIIASTQSRRRFWASVILSVEIMVVAYDRLNPWAWWLPIVIGLSALLALGYPNADASQTDRSVSSDGSSDLEEDESELRLPAVTSRPSRIEVGVRALAATPLQRARGVLAPG